MSAIHFFSPSYAMARERFLAAAGDVNATVRSYPIQSAEDPSLTIDVALLGPTNAPTILVSSGLHGAEGFFGSAIQLALLTRIRENIQPESPIRYAIVHALNPFGFANVRRTNEDNVDLNRNFYSDANSYTGAPAAYPKLDSFLNPESAPPKIDLFYAKAVALILRHGFQALKQAVAGGQYEYPSGLFFGGHGPCASTQIVFDHCQDWVSDSSRIVHIDLHSGLGKNGDYALLLNTHASSPDYAWYAENFGTEKIEPLGADQGTAYRVSGLFGNWMQQRFASQEYRFVGAEFGTYPALRVLAGLRRENRAHHYCDEEDAAYVAAKAELQECFCPRDPTWRNQVVESGLAIIERATNAIAHNE